ncbi:hypothetical protein [Tenacibaculum salmonis]|uniref:hypothetical protein n=1 Tax=Tenacibaculum sp. P3-BQ1 TaxID=3232310 RepID=UPI0034E04F7D
MKKSILNLGKALNKTEQKLVNGGGHPGYGSSLRKIREWCANSPCRRYTPQTDGLFETCVDNCSL